MTKVFRLLARTACATAATAAMATMTPATAAAQSTIFNIPSTDTVAPKKGYFEFDYLVQLPSPDGGGQFQTFVPRIVIGVTPALEVGANVATTHYGDGGGNYAYFQPNAKFKFFANDDAGVAATAGVVWYVPMNNRDISDTFGLIYGNVSKKIKSGNYGPRITGGLYVTASYDEDEQVGAILGYEQPITGKISFVADWFSGKNFFGYFTPGLSITLPHSGLFNIGYSLGNDSYAGNHNRALFVYYGITFP